MGIEDLGPLFDDEGNDITEAVRAKLQEGEKVSDLRKKFEAGIAESRTDKDARLAAEKEANELKRELLFRDSGIDLSSPMAQFFKENYNQGLTLDEIKASAAKIGLIATSADPAIQAEMEALNRIGSAATSAPPSSSALTPEEAVAQYSGNPDDFDDWFIAQYGSNLDKTNGGAVWDKSKDAPVTTPNRRRMVDY